jgi:hypothetical protein
MAPALELLRFSSVSGLHRPGRYLTRPFLRRRDAAFPNKAAHLRHSSSSRLRSLSRRVVQTRAPIRPQRKGPTGGWVERGRMGWVGDRTR